MLHGVCSTAPHLCSSCRPGLQPHLLCHPMIKEKSRMCWAAELSCFAAGGSQTRIFLADKMQISSSHLASAGISVAEPRLQQSKILVLLKRPLLSPALSSPAGCFVLPAQPGNPLAFLRLLWVPTPVEVRGNGLWVMCLMHGNLPLFFPERSSSRLLCLCSRILPNIWTRNGGSCRLAFFFLRLHFKNSSFKLKESGKSSLDQPVLKPISNFATSSLLVCAVLCVCCLSQLLSWT